MKPSNEQRVINKGAAGVDGMTVDEMLAVLVEHGEELRMKILSGKYRPKPIRRVEIPKNGWRCTTPGCANAHRADDTTGACAGVATNLRPEIPREQLWILARKE